MKQRDELKRLLKTVSETQLNLSSETAQDYLVDKIMEVLKSEEFDTYISCGGETPEKRGTHIDLRYNYIEGVGQLCKKCYNDIYNKDGYIPTI